MFVENHEIVIDASGEDISFSIQLELFLPIN